MAAVSSAAPNCDGMMLVEAPFAKVPHDELRRHLRTQQRLIERDLTFCSMTLEGMAKAAQTGASMPLMIPTATTTTTTTGSNTPGNISSGTQSRDAPDDEGEASAVDASLLGDVSFVSQQSRVSLHDDTGDQSMIRATLGETASSSQDIALKSTSDLDRSLDQMIGRIKGMKRKLSAVHESSGSTLTRLEARSNHLNELHNIQNTGSQTFDEWCRTRLDRMLVDWMLRKGFRKSAETLAYNRHIQDYVDLDLFAEIARIEASLVADPVQHSNSTFPTCTPTLAWCSENKAALRKIHSTLEFDLRVQEFIEMNRARTPQSLQEAILYSRKHLLPFLISSKAQKTANDGENATATTAGSSKPKPDEKEEREETELQDGIRKQVARVMGLLACGPNGWAYNDLYDPARWQQLRTKFRSAALQIHSLPPQPLLHIALSAGLSSLKLPACYADSPSSANAPPAHLGGRAFGDESADMLTVSGVTSVSAPPIFPPAAGVLQEAPSVVLSPPSFTIPTADAGHLAGHSNSSNGNSPASRSAALQMKNDNCPVCDTKGLNVLAKEVPWSHHANSTLVCAISGRMMDENDPPMALPNGRVYCQSALQELAASSQDGATVHCPRTGQSFPYNTLRKMYIS